MSQMAPAFFPPDFRGLVAGQQESLFAKAEEMLQVAGLGVGLLEVFQAKFVAALTHHQQP